MPRAYTDAERQAIIADLRREALRCMKTYGVRKTTVDELVRRAHIPKGTFYLFYPSKESLLLDAIQDIHDELQDGVVAALSALTVPPRAEEITDIIVEFYIQAEEQGFAALLAHGDLELLLRALPEEQVAAHLEKDSLSMGRLFDALPGTDKLNAPAFEGAFRAVFLCLLYRREIGAENFRESIRVMIHGLVLQLLA